VRYYEEYIDLQIRQGKSEQDVLQQLGDPRLLAKTVITTSKSTTESSNHQQQSYYEENDGESQTGGFWQWFMKLPSWIRSAFTAIVVILVLYLLARLIGFILPFVLAFAIILYLIRMFRGK